MVETNLLWMKDSYFDDTLDGELHAAIDMDSYKSNMERKLKESEKWQAAIINNIGDGVIAIDEKGFIKLINPFAETLTGWSKEDAVGKPLKKIFNIINEKTGEIAEDPVIKVIREGTFFGLSEQTTLVNRNGANIPVDIIGLPVLDDENNIMGITLVFYDIVERNKMERAIFSNHCRKGNKVKWE
ncbi:MAG: PAS domain S-box protein [Candidatus Methanoperedens sp.]